MDIKLIKRISVASTVAQVGWRVRQDSGWLSRLLWKALDWLGGLEQFYTTEKHLVYTDHQQKQVAELIGKHLLDNVISPGYSIDDYVVIMGEVEFSEVMKTKADYGQYLMLSAGEINFEHDGYRGRILGCPVMVVAGLSGVAVIPRVIVEKEK